MRLPRWEPGILEGEWLLVLGGTVYMVDREDAGSERQRRSFGPAQGPGPEGWDATDAEDPPPG